MGLNCGCGDMAELNKTIHIRKGSTEQTVKLYTTQTEVGYTYSYIIVDGVQAFIPLGAENDDRATMGRVKEHTGQQLAILATSGKPPYHKDSYTDAGTYTWTCPTGVTKAKVTCAGGGGGGLAVRTKALKGDWRIAHASGGTGELTTSIIDVTPQTSYAIVVGKGGNPWVFNTVAKPPYPSYAGDGEVSRFNTSVSARGGGGASLTFNGYNVATQGVSYNGGASGGTAWDTGANAGGTGWVYVEYGGDI